MSPPTQVSVPMKNTGVAYLLYFTLGGVGAHKLYLGRPGVALLYIGMLMLYAFGVAGLWAIAAEGPGVGAFLSGTIYLGMLAPLGFAYLYDLVTMPSQVHAANMRNAQQSFGGPPTGSTFRRDDDEELASKKADELIALYLAQRSQSAMQQKTIPAQTGSAPTFGKRRSE